MFRRRDPLSYYRAAREALWPRKGWVRALTYLKHRAARLPDPPDRVARGVMAGVLVTFTPFFGLHMILAAVLARVMRGNMLAAVAGTFIGNPLTFPIIVVSCLWTGKLMLGRPMEEGIVREFFNRFADAAEDLWGNLTAPFIRGQAMHWDGLLRFWNDLFLPYLIGGIVPGIAFGLVAYYLALPAVEAWQKGREARAEKRLARKLERMRKKAEKAAAKDAKTTGKGSA